MNNFNVCNNTNIHNYHIYLIRFRFIEQNKNNILNYSQYIIAESNKKLQVRLARNTQQQRKKRMIQEQQNINIHNDSIIQHSMLQIEGQQSDLDLGQDKPLCIVNDNKEQINNIIKPRQPIIRKSHMTCSSSSKHAHKKILPSITQSKLLLMIGLINQYQRNYQQQMSQHNKQIEKKHQQRKCKYHVSSFSQFHTLEPMQQKYLNMREVSVHFQKMKQTLVTILINNQNRRKMYEEQKQRQEINQLMMISSPTAYNAFIKSKSINLASINERNTITGITNNHQRNSNRFDDNSNSNTMITLVNQNNQNNQSKENINRNSNISNSCQNTFISHQLYNKKIINNLRRNSYSNNSQFQKQFTLQSQKRKFQLLKNKSIFSNLNKNHNNVTGNILLNPLKKHLKTNSCFRLSSPTKVTTQFQSRKKQQIRVFLNFDEKTQHLQNFRNVQGMLFKFNENLKITCKSINLCRIVLLNKKQIMITSSLIKSQKTTRVDKYLEQVQLLYAKIEIFLVTFIKQDKIYLKYLQENRSKKKQNVSEKYTNIRDQQYSEFIDKCFHMAEIVRIYFNVMNQQYHQNIKNEQDLKFSQLEKVIKALINLRYFLVYLQKQCQNTSTLKIFKDSQDSNEQNSKRNNQNINECTIQNLTNKDICKGKDLLKSNCEKNYKSQKKINTSTLTQDNRKTLKSYKRLPQKQKLSSSQTNLQKQEDQQKQNFDKLNKSSLMNIKKTKNFLKNKRQKSQKVQIDIQNLWRTFYDKKFSSKSIKLRLY